MPTTAPNVLDVHKAIKATLVQLTIANGYSFNLPKEHTYDSMRPEIVNDDQDDSFPKCFLVVDKGTTRRLVASQKNRTFNFKLYLATKWRGDSDESNPSYRGMEMVADVEKLFDQNQELGGLVTDIQVTEYVTDGGFAWPESWAMVNVQATYIGVR